ncbi:hypothetical protein ACJX0J_013918, partial [Zea mays]
MVIYLTNISYCFWKTISILEKNKGYFSIKFQFFNVGAVLIHMCVIKYTFIIFYNSKLPNLHNFEDQKIFFDNILHISIFLNRDTTGKKNERIGQTNLFEQFNKLLGWF